MRSLGAPRRVRGNACLACGKNLTGAAVADGVETPEPQDGDHSLCIYCGHVMIFDKGGTLRNPTPAEQEDIRKDELIQSALAVLARIIGRQ